MTEKQALRAEYRRIRRNYRQLLRRDYEKYLVPDDVSRYIPRIPAIIENERLFKNAAISRIAGAVRRLNKAIAGYKAYRLTFERLDDAYLRRYESKIIDVMTDTNPPFKVRARRIWEKLKTNISNSKRDRHLIAARILKRWTALNEFTNRYIFESLQPSMEFKRWEYFLEVITLIFRPYSNEDTKFKKLWDDIDRDLQQTGDDGIDDNPFDLFY